MHRLECIKESISWHHELAHINNKDKKNLYRIWLNLAVPKTHLQGFVCIMKFQFLWHYLLRKTKNCYFTNVELTIYAYACISMSIASLLTCQYALTYWYTFTWLLETVSKKVPMWQEWKRKIKYTRINERKRIAPIGSFWMWILHLKRGNLNHALLFVKHSNKMK